MQKERLSSFKILVHEIHFRQQYTLQQPIVQNQNSHYYRNINAQANTSSAQIIVKVTTQKHVHHASLQGLTCGTFHQHVKSLRLAQSAYTAPHALSRRQQAAETRGSSFYMPLSQRTQRPSSPSSRSVPRGNCSEALTSYSTCHRSRTYTEPHSEFRLTLTTLSCRAVDTLFHISHPWFSWFGVSRVMLTSTKQILKVATNCQGTCVRTKL